ncbi:unnamed protein product [Acanthoscelides obtectus]|uniref:Uncharacterized protein n=1 Tax=Acanthoscelides obtectus TaxID=200917 RepID=A0A9P0MMN4_ACAOB|nr:unnamed protein product [Acanthoscelides obtectus]CAK1650817.1 Flotillin-1 [Acanthoscelides obtectus]
MTWGFVTCGPNEALVVSGCCHSKPLLIPGGRAFVWPFVQRIQSMTLPILTKCCNALQWWRAWRISQEFQ